MPHLRISPLAAAVFAVGVIALRLHSTPLWFTADGVSIAFWTVGEGRPFISL